MTASCPQMMFYMIPMLLGRTYDVKKSTVGIDIFRHEDINESMRNPIPVYQSSSKYATLESAVEKRSFLDISGELALKIKSGMLDVKGAGDYLKKTSDFDNSLQILVHMTFMSVIHELKPEVEPGDWWRSLPKENVGTHYVRQLAYGGEVYASVQFKALKSEDFENIQAEIKASISTSGGAFDANAQANLTSLIRNITGKASVEIDYYANLPLEGVPTSIEGLNTLVHNFKEQVERVNNGLGVPICAGLRELSAFDKKFSFIQHHNLMSWLNDTMDRKFEDVRTAKSQLKDWLEKLPSVLIEEYEKKLVDFSKRVNTAVQAFYDVIWNLNLEKGPEQLAPANEAFDKNAKIVGPNAYKKEMRTLISEFVAEDDPNDPRGVYIHWGKRTCSLPSVKIVYIGFTASFLHEQIGSGSEFLCLPENPKWGNEHYKEQFDLREAQIGGVKYRKFAIFKKTGKKIEDKVVPCVICEVPLRPTIVTFPLATSCPEGWIEEYSGYIASSLAKDGRSEYICIDSNPDIYPVNKQTNKDPQISPVVLSPGVLDATVFKMNSVVPCVVCSK